MVKWNAYEVLFGRHNQDKCVGSILLQAKYFLYCNRTNKQLPSIEVFKKHMVSYHQTERYNALKCFQITKLKPYGKNTKIFSPLFDHITLVVNTLLTKHEISRKCKLATLHPPSSAAED